MSTSISIITPTVRPEGCEIIAKCLRKQDFQDFEWLIVAPEHLRAEIESYTASQPHKFVAEPPRREGDFYRLCGAWNKAWANSQGKLSITIQDKIWFPPDMLSRFWEHYVSNPKAVVTAVGNHFSELDSIGKPQNQVWQDPRMRTDLGTFYEVAPSEIEFSVVSLPQQALIDSGGIDEIYDTCPAAGEKEMVFRMRDMGYQMFIDQSIEYRAIHHGRLNENWDKEYIEKTTKIFINHMNQLSEGRRDLNCHCLEIYNEVV